MRPVFVSSSSVWCLLLCTQTHCTGREDSPQRPIIQTIPDQKSAEESGGDLDQCELNLCYLYLCMQGQPQAPSCGCQGPMIKFDKQNEQCAGCAVRRGALL